MSRPLLTSAGVLLCLAAVVHLTAPGPQGALPLDTSLVDGVEIRISSGVARFERREGRWVRGPLSPGPEGTSEPGRPDYSGLTATLDRHVDEVMSWLVAQVCRERPIRRFDLPPREDAAHELSPPRLTLRVRQGKAGWHRILLGGDSVDGKGCYYFCPRQDTGGLLPVAVRSEALALLDEVNSE